MPKVSVIIPSYNSERTIVRTVSSCLNQTYSDLEVIVIDDGSTDSTGEILKQIKDERLKYFYFENSGRSEARNKGIHRAKGDYIQFLDSDDTLHSEKIEKGLSILEHDNTFDAVQCGTGYIKDNQLVNEFKAIPRDNVNNVLLRENIFPIHSVLFRKECASSFPKGLSYCEDWYFWIKTLWNKKIFFQEEYIGANVYIHSENTMTNYQQMLLGELYILLRIKHEINRTSLARDFKIIKQYIYYSIVYNVGMDILEDYIKSDFTLLLYLRKINNLSFIRNTLLRIINMKQKLKENKSLY
ncbi:glycosyltransferase family 2 protein [Robertmurraya sp. P23]|uniref:glycosyltransferase family 2 protein n=1 Tax=Robertmurraya sp. P23 TaxID=3436931 RepID=UPI003D95E4E0